MKSFLKKSALVLCGLLLSIIIIGQFFPQTERTAASPVVAEKVLVPGGQSVGVKMDVRGVLIVGLEEIEGKSGEKVNPGLLSGLQPVSYTHLDVYKRQVLDINRGVVNICAVFKPTKLSSFC